MRLMALVLELRLITCLCPVLNAHVRGRRVGAHYSQPLVRDRGADGLRRWVERYTVLAHQMHFAPLFRSTVISRLDTAL